MLHGVDQDVCFLLDRKVCRDIADAGVENFRIEDAHVAGGGGCGLRWQATALLAVYR